MVRVLALAAVLLASGAMSAKPVASSGFYRTGQGVWVKKIVFPMEVYEVVHEIKVVPTAKSRQAMIEALVDKRLVLTMKRDLDREKLQSLFHELYARQTATKPEHIEHFLAPLDHSKKNDVLVVMYHAKSKTTSLTMGKKTSSVIGDDFMKITWKLWFDDPTNHFKLGEQLVSNL